MTRPPSSAESPSTANAPGPASIPPGPSRTLPNAPTIAVAHATTSSARGRAAAERAEERVGDQAEDARRPPPPPGARRSSERNASAPSGPPARGAERRAGVERGRADRDAGDEEQLEPHVPLGRAHPPAAGPGPGATRPPGGRGRRRRRPRGARPGLYGEGARDGGYSGRIGRKSAPGWGARGAGGPDPRAADARTPGVDAQGSRPVHRVGGCVQIGCLGWGGATPPEVRMNARLPPPWPVPRGRSVGAPSAARRRRAARLLRAGGRRSGERRTAARGPSRKPRSSWAAGCSSIPSPAGRGRARARRATTRSTGSPTPRRGATTTSAARAGTARP